MRLFLTGATGFIGKHLVKALLREGHAVTALLLPREDEDGLKDCRVVRGDITDPPSLRGKMKDHDAVVHLAGAVGYGQTMEKCLRINRDGTGIVLAEALSAGIRRFVHISSVSVYGRKSRVRIDENFPLRKIGDPYGDTKIDAENLLHAAEKEQGLELTVVRPTVIYGPGDDKFLPKLLENLKHGRARIIGSGDNPVNVIHIRDVADFFSLVLRDYRSVGRTYNLTHMENPSWKEMLQFIAQELGLPAPRRHVPYGIAFLAAAWMEWTYGRRGQAPPLTRYAVRVVGRPYHYVMERARAELGYQPQVTLYDGLRECLAG